MKRNPGLLLALAAGAALLVAELAVAETPDPQAVPGIGTVAPAFGLYPLQSYSQSGQKPDGTDPVQLDEYCGLRPDETKLVLVVFVDAAGRLLEGEPLTSWHRKFHKEGLEILAIAIERNPSEFAARVKRAHFRFQVLDDRQRVVAHRYGVDKAPVTFLLDAQCRVLGVDATEPADKAAKMGAAIEALLKGTSEAAEIDQ